MSFPEAFKGAQVELRTCKSNAERVSKLFHIARILAAEAAGALSMVPYGYSAFQLYRSLPLHGRGPHDCQLSAAVAKDIRYGLQPRTVMDIYVPHQSHDPQEDSTQSESRRSSPAARPGHRQPEAVSPVALFCHGGVWATGEKWHYAPMATRLAQCGILTCVVSYTLYPQAKARDMIAELSEALSWTLDNIVKYGGDPNQVSALGHSAGAQMWAMVLLGRARAAGRRAKRRSSDSGREATGRLDLRMPARFIGVAGVYNIAEHLKYEAGRGVRYLSTMERALGGEAEFAGQSPPVILAHAAAGERESCSDDSAAAERQAERSGEHMAKETGLAGSGVAIAPSTAVAAAAPFLNVQGGTSLQEVHQRSSTTPGKLDFDREDATHLPPCLLYSSKTDLTVPWTQSALMEQALQACRVPVQHECFEDASVGHASFVTDWKPLPMDERSIPEWNSASMHGATERHVPEREMGNKESLPVHLKAIISSLQGLRH